MKTMTCRQLGGACDLPLAGETGDEVIKAQDQHLKEIVAGGDTEHEKALKEMKGRWKHPSRGWVGTSRSSATSRRFPRADRGGRAAARGDVVCPRAPGLVGWADGNQRHVVRTRHRPPRCPRGRPRRTSGAGAVPRPLPADARAEVRRADRRAAGHPVGPAVDDVAARAGAPPRPGRAPWFRRVLEGRGDLPRLYRTEADPDLDFNGAVPDAAVVADAWRVLARARSRTPARSTPG